MSTVCGVDLAGSSGQTVPPVCPARPPSSRSVEFRVEIGSLPARDRSSSAPRSVQLTDLDAERARGGGLWVLIPRRHPASPRLVGASRTEADSLLVPIIQSAKRASVADLRRSPCRLLSNRVAERGCRVKGRPSSGGLFLSILAFCHRVSDNDVDVKELTTDRPGSEVLRGSSSARSGGPLAERILWLELNKMAFWGSCCGIPGWRLRRVCYKIASCRST